ncbi:DUF1601 domain-containing protein [Wolbachia endosymbiont (group A) of Agelastica alni]|uniref:DUF1601 domain-containing protein n=1 Tax=Wolbachia endosymbiont (group A) of Agelastica alni TaxID=3066130 RepID=UPI0031333D08
MRSCTGSKTLIYKLVQQGNTIKSKDFNSQDIANTLNALSKWDVLNSDVWDGKVTIDDQQVGEVEQFKTLIYKLVEQGIQSSTQFNSQAIANTLNALSKWDVLNTEIQQGSKEKCKTLIYKLVQQGNKIFEDSNSQEIANTLNSLSKFDILGGEKWTKNEQNKIKSLIVQLAEKGQEPKVLENFNSQAIANTFDALYKFDILDNEKWTEDEQNKIKSLIVQLAKKGQGIYEEFNSQAIANTFNAFSKLNILDNKWTSNEQEELKYFIVQLAKRGGSIEGYNLKDIAKIYSALLEWSNIWNPDEFKSLTDKLEEQVQAIAQKQNEEDNILDNIRFTSQIINDLPKLKSKKLITSDVQLLVHLMQCLSASVDKSKDSDLKRDWPKKDILSGLKGFVNIINELEDKSNLRGKFDRSIIKIFKKLSAVKLDSEYNEKIPEIINKLIEWEIIKDKDALKKFPTIGNVSQSESKVLDGKEEDNTGTALSGATISNQSPKANMQSCRGSKSKKKDKDALKKFPTIGNISQSESKVLDGKEEDNTGTALSGATTSNQSPEAKTQGRRGSKSKKKDKVLDGKEEDKPGTALSGATISNHQSPEARTQGRRGFRCECLIL